jgi:Tfp pilus assembly PilM family ATPase
LPVVVVSCLLLLRPGQHLYQRPQRLSRAQLQQQRRRQWRQGQVSA